MIMERELKIERQYLEKHEISYVLFQKCLKKQKQIMEPLRFAVEQLELSGSAQYAKLSSAIPAQQIATVGAAYLSSAYQ